MVGSAIRLIGTPGGTQGFTTILELQAEGSAEVDNTYLDIFTSHWLLPPDDPAMDKNGNGRIDFVDFAELASKWQGKY